MRQSAPFAVLIAAVGAIVAASATAQLPDFVAPPGVTVLDTGRSVVQPTAGPPITVVGGVFRFRNVTIPAGSTVRGVGPKPMLWIVDNLNVDGELTVSGEDGEAVTTLNSANIPARGGGGGGGGGDGGLLVPPGNNSDGTNTLLDDNIVLMQNGQVLTGATKQRVLAWRCFAGPNGVRLDDAGVPTHIGSSEGDIRPSPVLITLL